MKNYKIFILISFTIIILLIINYFFGSKINNMMIYIDSDSPISIRWYKNEDNDYYFFLPKEIDRNNVIINYELFDSGTNVSLYDIDKNKLCNLSNNSNISFFTYDVLVIKTHKKFSKDHKYIIHIMQSDLPSLFIDVDSYDKILKDKYHSKIKSTGELYLFDNDTINTFKINEFRGRGNSTWLRPKKPYQIRFSKETSILGIRESKKLLLLANHWDGSLSRNYLWLHLAKELGVDYNVDTYPVDLFINSNYIGSYLVTNKITSKSVYDNNDYLVEVTNTIHYDVNLKHGYHLNIKYPNVKKMSLEERNNAIDEVTEYMNDMEELVYGDATLEEISESIDLDSFIKLYWVQEFSLNYDALRGSNYFYRKDNMLHMGPVWDMDNTMNRSYYYSDYDEDYILTNSKLQARIFENWFIELSKKDGFLDMVRDYYIDNYDIFNGLVDDINNYRELITNSAYMNYVKWSYNDMKDEQIRNWISNDIDFDSSMDLLEEGIKKRLDYFNNKYNLN